MEPVDFNDFYWFIPASFGGRKSENSFYLCHEILPIFIDFQAVATGDSPSCAARMGGESLQHITLITNTYSNKPSAQPKANRGS